MSFVFHEVVFIINKMFRNLISWLCGDEMQEVMAGFKIWCDLPFVQGAINGTHIAISKPLGPFPKDYYYHNMGGYNIIA